MGIKINEKPIFQIARIFLILQLNLENWKRSCFPVHLIYIMNFLFIIQLQLYSQMTIVFC